MAYLSLGNLWFLYSLSRAADRVQADVLIRGIETIHLLPGEDVLDSTMIRMPEAWPKELPRTGSLLTLGQDRSTMALSG
jgi:hypothetical protein